MLCVIHYIKVSEDNTMKKYESEHYIFNYEEDTYLEENIEEYQQRYKGLITALKL